jgi:hypothetical protein
MDMNNRKSFDNISSVQFLGTSLGTEHVIRCGVIGMHESADRPKLTT